MMLNNNLEKNFYDDVFKDSKILNVDKKSVILREGEVSDKIYFIQKGCLRLCFNDDGKDTTLQFFFENQIVSSFESLFLNEQVFLA